MSNSTEEEIARDYICFGNADVTVVIIDATCLERNLNLVYQILEITDKVVVCINLLDEAKNKGIHIDFDALSKVLGVPVVGTIAKKAKTLNNLIKTIDKVCSNEIVCTPKIIKYDDNTENLISTLLPTVQNLLPQKYQYLSRWITIKIIDGDEKILSSICNFASIDLNNMDLKNSLSIIHDLMQSNFSFRDSIITNIITKAEEVASEVCIFEKDNYNNRDKKIDKILTSKIFGFPIMLLFLGVVFWITITGANYPSSLLSEFFSYIQKNLLLWFDYMHAPDWLSGVLINGIFQTVSWVVSVMLPPMAIFFPLFTLLEDLGYLPRIAFNLDRFFKKACSSRQASSNYVYGVWM